MIQLDYLEELERFQLALKRNASSIQSGEHKSPQTGQGMVFKDHKEYIPGDDIRKIDWKAYARTKDFFVKRFEEERRLNIHILLDRSSSMDYGNVNKYEFSAKLGLGVAKMSMNTNDKFNYSIFSETLTNISSGRRTNNISELVEVLNNTRKTPESRIEDCITEYSDRIQNESAVIIFSDFLADPEKVEAGIESLKHTKPIIVNVLDSSELDPDFEGDKILKDPESSSKLRTFLSRKTRQDYRSKMEEHVQELEEISRRNGAEFIQASTEDDIFQVLLSIWEKLNN
ncbi:DUF58 domain-containing protein [Candidatus Nanosalina sp. VS9-1]|uniref:DUF58 domain-containing protein n=1 Tax=Candidatus Nanosalina sp. VS9-1 TaxID=3388566 RepID=UPI0039E01DAD